MVIDITHQVDVLFTLFALAIGLDILVSGFCVLIDKNLKHTPKFIGFLLLKGIEKSEKRFAGRKYGKKPFNRFARIVFTLKVFGYYFVIVGPILITMSLFLLSSK